MEFIKERVEARDGRSMAEAPQEAMKLLRQFQFSRQRWNERVSMLSGGERRRLQLMSVLTKRPNFLVVSTITLLIQAYIFSMMYSIHILSLFLLITLSLTSPQTTLILIL